MEKASFKRSIAIMSVTLLVLTGCGTLSSNNAWPTEIPAKNLFLEHYYQQVKAGTNNEPVDSHLVWIKRFYFGSAIYPTGWLDMKYRVVDSLESTHQKLEAAHKIDELGVRIVNEWAQPNTIRRINSSNVATWGSSLKKSVKLSNQFEFLEKVSSDVEMLIAGDLDVDDIDTERYYPSEDYDNF